MIDGIGDVIVWMVRNWEIVLGIFVSMVVIGALMKAYKKTELMGWSDEKLKARQTYLLYQDRNRLEEDEYWMIRDELDRRLHTRCKQSATEEWSKYE